jgi:hypothetical protein
VIPLAQAPFAGRVANAVIAYMRYIEMANWPRKLGVFYPREPASIRNVAVSLLIVMMITGQLSIGAGVAPMSWSDGSGMLACFCR